ncbi:hypothetical protein C0Q70_09264 [Pomacea canaliculata]|uniref:G-protein coupled receptors family 1 profile domain-containing protein n=1 Tax=Pomacea canaliculata TaxID=400727 RepID=A0A2T7P9A6_POMCA|nr:hypothetical protein C0Q70_09264 [Pomacea canaliculata]
MNVSLLPPCRRHTSQSDISLAGDVHVVQSVGSRHRHLPVCGSPPECLRPAHSSRALPWRVLLLRELAASAPSGGRRCFFLNKDNANLVLFLVFAIALSIASLPVVGYGPDVMPDNRTCSSWLVDTPDTARRRTYFLAFLAFGFLNLLTVFLAVTSTLVTLNHLAKWTRSENHFRYTEDLSPPLVEPESLQAMYKMIGLILINQILWLPALVLLTIQKAGYPISDATLMYTILSASLPGLVNPLLLGLLFRDFRQGYLHVIRKACFCFCYSSASANEQSMKDLQYRSRNARNYPEDAENFSTASIDSCDINAAKSSLHTCVDKTQPHVHGEDQGAGCKTGTSYVMVQGLADERTPLQVTSSVPCRPIVASLYDEFGEISQEPKTELLSPCGSEDCLLTSDLFREQSESVVEVQDTDSKRLNELATHL